MPTYEYQCSSCGHHLEAFQKMSDSPLVDCPNCNQKTLTKLLSPSNFHLKGTGWYVTDIRDKNKPKPAEEANGGTESGAGSSDKSSTDTTPTTASTHAGDTSKTEK